FKLYVILLIMTMSIILPIKSMVLKNTNIYNDTLEPQELTHEVLNLEKPKMYKIVIGTQRTTKIIRDNMGFLYYKNKKTENKMLLKKIKKCYNCTDIWYVLNKKTENSCRETAHISPDQNNDKLVLCKQHNHQERLFNEEVPLLRQKLTEEALQKSVCSYSSRGIYMEEIVNSKSSENSFPLVYAILSGKTEEIYVELLSYIRNVLPLTYSQLTIITDYEYGLMKAIKTIFPESDQQGCNNTFYLKLKN
ncbi:Uncharacterized protein FWK35_00030739, partial [Aphis craccivora]